MATTPSVRVIKSFAFKGGTRLWSNRYHFNGGTPADGTHWDTLFTNIVNAEKAIIPSTSTIVECIGYAAGSDVPVRTKTFSTAGTHTTGGFIAPGECAALVRFSTAARTSKNHPLYLFNYYHAADCSTATAQQDKLVSGYVTALDTYSAAWISGFSDGTITAVRAGPNGDAATGHFTEEYVTHRDFPYTRSA